MAKKRKINDEIYSLVSEDDFDVEEEAEVAEVVEEEEEVEVEEQEEENSSGDNNDNAGDDDDGEEEEDITKLLEPLNKEQLIDLLRSAASNDPKVLEEIHRVADIDPAHRKLFVHGLDYETTSESLRDFFSKYGELLECNIVLDKITCKSKGFAFMLFKHRQAAQKALKQPVKQIDNRKTTCQLASAGPVNTLHAAAQQQASQDALLRKIYVGNVPLEAPADKLLAFFSKYGEIEEGPLGFDKKTGKSKGFAFFIYKTQEGAKKVVEEPNKNFEGHQLYCQKATDNKLKVGAVAVAVAGAATVNKLKVGAVAVAGAAATGNATGFNAPNGIMVQQASAAPAVVAQGLVGGARPYRQGAPPNQAAAGQKYPAAYGVSPAVFASPNLAFSAAMNAGPPPVASSTVPQAILGYKHPHPGYQHPNPGYQHLNPGYQYPNPDYRYPNPDYRYPIPGYRYPIPGYQYPIPGYQHPQAHHVNNSYQSGPIGYRPAPGPHSAVGPMGEYVVR